MQCTFIYTCANMIKLIGGAPRTTMDGESSVSCSHEDGRIHGIANTKRKFLPVLYLKSPELNITQSQFTLLDPSTRPQQYQNDRDNDSPCGNVDGIQVVGCLGRRQDSRNLQQ